MKMYLILLLLLILVIFVCACSSGKAGEPPQENPPAGDPMDIASFSFQHSASMAGDCYMFTVAKKDGEIHLYAEEQFSGGRIVDTMIEEPVLTQLGEMVGIYHIDLWDGFDKSRRDVLDGSSFSLEVTLADGSTICARGNNSFPQQYSEVYAVVWELYTGLMDRYGLEQTEHTS